MNKTALTTQDVADILKIAKNTVYELIKRGELNSYKVGRKIRFTMQDVEDYIARFKSIKPSESIISKDIGSSSKFVICGQDQMLDVLANYMGQHGFPVLRAHIGSYDSLRSLYLDEVQVASAHLWDGDSEMYNVPFVRRLLPGIPTVLVHLTCRVQGFYVAKGNPKEFEGWDDLRRDNITIINREKGAGSRVLLDEQLRLLDIKRQDIKGYNVEGNSHFIVAGAVARGEADLAVGTQSAVNLVKNVDFIPLQKERYDLVFKKEEFDSPTAQTLIHIIRSEKFQSEFSSLRGYDISDMGKIVAIL